MQARHETRLLCFSRNTSFSIMFPAAISHDFPRFPGISQVPPPPAHQVPPPPHCRRPGHRLHGCIALPRNGPGLHVSPSGNEKSGRVKRRESGLSTSTTANRRNTVKTAGRTACLGFWGHETRDTGFFRHASRLFPKHGLYGRSIRRGCARDAQPETAARTTAPAARSLLACALWRGCGAAGAAVVVWVERHGAAYCP